MKEYQSTYRLGFIKNGHNGIDKKNYKFYTLYYFYHGYYCFYYLNNKIHISKGYYNMGQKYSHWKNDYNENIYTYYI